MSVTIENSAPCRKKLRIEVDADRVAGARAEIVRDFRKHASIPGFRPGKAPEPMLEKRFGHEIDEELRRRLIPDSYREALAENKLRAIGFPQIESVEYLPGKSLVFTAAIDTAPEFNLPDYKAISVKKKIEPVTDEDVAKIIDSLRAEHADFVPVEGRGIQTGDFAVVDYVGVAGGKPISELVPDSKTLGEQKEFWLLIESNAFLPGFSDQLIGAQPGEKRQVLLTFPADFPQKKLAGHHATYFVDVVGIKKKSMPELSDELAKKIGVDSVEKMKDSIRKSLEAQHEAEANAELRKQIVDQLLSRVDFELPESLVAQETRGIVYDLVRENSLRGVTKEQLEEKKNEIFGFATQTAKDRLRASFILDTIADAEGIVVTKSELDTRVIELAQRYRMAPEKLRAQLTQRGALGEIEDQVRTGKTLDFLLSNAKVESA
jgi:trigger factor